MTTNSQDDNSGVLESSRSPAEALRQQILEIIKGFEPVGHLDGSPGQSIIPSGYDLLKDERTEYGFYWEYEDMEICAEKINKLVTAYAATVEREGRLEELNDIPHIPIFLYSTRHDSQKLADAMEMSKIASLHVLKRRDELARLAALQGPQEQDDTPASS